MMHTIKKIRSIRLEKGYTQEYMASQLNIGQRAYCKLECGYSNLTVSRLKDISKIIDVSAISLLR